MDLSWLTTCQKFMLKSDGKLFLTHHLMHFCTICEKRSNQPTQQQPKKRQCQRACKASQIITSGSRHRRHCHHCRDSGDDEIHFIAHCFPWEVRQWQYLRQQQIQSIFVHEKLQICSPYNPEGNPANIGSIKPVHFHSCSFFPLRVC